VVTPQHKISQTLHPFKSGHVLATWFQLFQVMKQVSLTAAPDQKQIHRATQEL
jgi:hypothetical protein